MNRLEIKLMEALFGNLNFLSTDQEQLKTAFDDMEFEGFFDDSSKKDHCGIGGARKWLGEGYEAGNICVYGRGGGNRYFVKHDGDIFFSAHHALPKDVEKARALGFQIL